MGRVFATRRMAQRLKEGFGKMENIRIEMFV